MNIIICGCEHTESGLKEIKELLQFLQNIGYDMIQCAGDRGLSDLSFNQTIEKELEQIEKADVLILILRPTSCSPNLGSAVKAYKFALSTKPVIIYTQDEVNPDAWSTLIARKICRSKKELLDSIEELAEPEKIGVIPNIHSDHQAEFEYKDFKCVCPVTGERDRATIRITYVPQKWLMEYESPSLL